MRSFAAFSRREWRRGTAARMAGTSRTHLAWAVPGSGNEVREGPSDDALNGRSSAALKGHPAQLGNRIRSLGRAPLIRA